MKSEQNIRTIAISGASGFVGHHLVNELLDKTTYNIIALSRTERQSHHPRLEWRKADFFSLLELEIALKDVDAAYYLIHSMAPSARLVQGSFEDLDLLLADNFSRACLFNNIEQVIYLGGIVNPNDDLSKHLMSRLEVEKTLSHKSFALTTFRAGLIIGENSSSFIILKNLIKNLPILICPKWSQKKLTPIDIMDVVHNLKASLLNERFYKKTLNIGGNETLSYYELIKRTAHVMGKKRLFFKIPFSFISISKFWVKLFSNTKKELVYPLLDSLKHDMFVIENENIVSPMTALDDSLLNAINQNSLKSSKKTKPKKINYKKEKTVRSVQRLNAPPLKNIKWVAKEYMKWLPSFLYPFLIVSIDGDYIIFALLSKKFKLLILKYSELRSSSERQLFYIRGGLLALKNPKGRLEFREVLNKENIISAIHDFKPRLPWGIYRFSQAIIHIFVMWAFGRHLNKVGKK